jgi:hypothetical protein
MLQHLILSRGEGKNKKKNSGNGIFFVKRRAAGVAAWAASLVVRISSPQ